ncbi:phosphoglycerate mutase family protein [Mytilinidion resinicola]|uniref:Phosphoglycerate mutase family protein n=1 Tax=Mytilinidion resinicola TaxID=574789 RepID=A0A6A6ZAY2_9PEZI|nr:phosphoglycerate mutase family protein [Mytilinidion resinicola]KAF2817464.1 phosphoglycerate mutase family protein [Mytilinidion resinicola]
MGDTSLVLPEANPSTHVEYSTVKGYFLQSEESTDSSKFDFKKSNFGLIDRTYETDNTFSNDLELSPAKDQWQRFVKYVRYLNEHAPNDVKFKVIFMGRHGQGWHNVAESKYGTEAWDCHWSLLDGADGITWADANLTDLGKQQAQDAHQLWNSLLAGEENGIPSPETYYVSPLVRAIQTAVITFDKLDLPQELPFKPVVKELLREAIGVHTCDRRSSATFIRDSYPFLTIEDGFAETDPLWTVDLREPSSARRVRMTALLDDVFATDENTFISFTSHSGAIRSLLEAVSHRSFGLETGGVIPVFVKAQTVRGERKTPDPEPSGTPPSCATNPTSTPSL